MNYTTVYVNRCSPGEKYLFANISIPNVLVPAGIDHPADLAKLIDRWVKAYQAQEAAPFDDDWKGNP